MAAWATLVAGRPERMEPAWWVLVLPSRTMVITLMRFNYRGDGLREAIDPEDR